MSSPAGLGDDQLEELERLEAAMRKRWDRDWNGPLTSILASDGSGKHIASATSVEIADYIIALRNAAPALIAAARREAAMRESLREILDEYTGWTGPRSGPEARLKRAAQIASNALAAVGPDEQ